VKNLPHRLQAAGLTEIEVTSYVSPKWVPQMADNHAVMSGIARQSGVRYSVLTPNLKGYESALLDRPDEIVVFGAASEAFSQKNINCSIEESMERFAPVVQAALAAGIAVRGAMSCTVGCPYEGEVSPASVAHLAGLMKQIGVQRVDVADTIGTGTPLKVQRAIEATLQHFDIDHIVVRLRSAKRLPHACAPGCALAQLAELLPDQHHLRLAARQEPSDRCINGVASHTKEQYHQKCKPQQGHEDFDDPVHLVLISFF